MPEWVLFVLLAVVRALFRARARDTLSALGQDPDLGDPAVVDALTDAVTWARERAWAVSVLFLRGQARDAGADEAWVPPAPVYDRAAVAEVVRQAAGVGEARLEGVLTALDRHVETAARQTVRSAVEDAPERVPTLAEDLDEFLGGLDGYPQEVRDLIASEVEAVAPDGWDDWDEERRQEVFAQVAGRVQRALDLLAADGIFPPYQETPRAVEIVRESAPAVSDVMPPEAASDPGHVWWRTDRKGRVIARPFAWARVVHPSAKGPCGFCAMLAARGPVYRSQDTAGSRYHDNCVCTCVPVYTSAKWPGREESIRYAELYDEVVRKAGLHTSQARTAMDNAVRGTRSAEKSQARNRRKVEEDA